MLKLINNMLIMSRKCLSVLGKYSEGDHRLDNTNSL